MKNLYKITPWWLTGFTQADGSFSVSFERRPDGKLPFYPQPVFTLTQSERERSMMLAIHAYLGVGQLSESKGCITLTVRNLKDLLNVVIPHFEQYPLLGGKQLAFLRFKIVCILKSDKMHLELPGLLQIVQLCCIKPELYDMIMITLKQKFGDLPYFEPIDIEKWLTTPPEAFDMEIDYVTDLIDGDGSINFSFPKGQRRVIPNVTVIAAFDDLAVLELLIKFFGCGKIYKLPSHAYVFKIEKIDDLLVKVFPLLQKGVFNTVKRTYLDISYEALLILQAHGVKEDIHLLAIVDLVYEMNQGGKNRKLSKAAYCKLFISSSSVFN